MGSKTYLSTSAAVILQALANGYQYGFDVMDITGLPSGTVYPALRRMEQAGFVNSRWEHSETAQRDGRPLRKYYEVTPTGMQALTQAAARYRFLDRVAPHPTRKPNPSHGQG
jgi:PadR family transcriptional regulator PadR